MWVGEMIFGYEFYFMIVIEKMEASLREYVSGNTGNKHYFF